MDNIFILSIIVIVIAFIAGIAVTILKLKCPACGKMFAGRVAGMNSAETPRNLYTVSNHYRVQRYVALRRCKFCGHEWETRESRRTKG
ncbi:MAG: hypothetical protein HPY53_12255 [Brevinematales bacterium]|nr:hypothetical protein [Brevinematales bacterium]